MISIKFCVFSWFQALQSKADEKFSLLYSQLFASRSPTFYKQKLISAKDVVMHNTVLGTGQYGVVYIGDYVGGGKARQSRLTVAIKTIKSKDENTLIQFLLEARLLAMMDHAHIVQLIGVQECVLPIMLVMEYLEEGNLLKKLKLVAWCASLRCDEITAKLDMSRQMASAVAYLHSHLCIHRDLAARNVLVSKNINGVESQCGVVLKLGDLGLSRTLQREDDYYRVSWKKWKYQMFILTCHLLRPPATMWYRFDGTVL